MNADTSKVAAAPDALLTEKEAATILCIKPGTVASLRRRGELKAVAVGYNRLYRYHRDDLAEFIAARRGVSR